MVNEQAHVSAEDNVVDMMCMLSKFQVTHHIQHLNKISKLIKLLNQSNFFDVNFKNVNQILILPIEWLL